MSTSFSATDDVDAMKAYARFKRTRVPYLVDAVSMPRGTRGYAENVAYAKRLWADEYLFTSIRAIAAKLRNLKPEKLESLRLECAAGKGIAMVGDACVPLGDDKFQIDWPKILLRSKARGIKPLSLMNWWRRAAVTLSPQVRAMIARDHSMLDSVGSLYARSRPYDL